MFVSELQNINYIIIFQIATQNVILPSTHLIIFCYDIYIIDWGVELIISIISNIVLKMQPDVIQ